VLQKIVMFKGDIVSASLLHMVMKRSSIGSAITAITLINDPKMRFVEAERGGGHISVNHFMTLSPELGVQRLNEPMLLLSWAFSWAQRIISMSKEIGGEDRVELYYGGHLKWNDGSPSAFNAKNAKALGFVDAMARLMYIESSGKVQLKAPYLLKRKAEIIEPYIGAMDDRLEEIDYSKTWDCLNNAEIACEMCDGCIERRVAFAENFIRDPISRLA
jgi:hypothetical protein